MAEPRKDAAFFKHPHGQHLAYSQTGRRIRTGLRHLFPALRLFRTILPWDVAFLNTQILERRSCGTPSIMSRVFLKNFLKFFLNNQLKTSETIEI